MTFLIFFLPKCVNFWTKSVHIEKINVHSYRRYKCTLKKEFKYLILLFTINDYLILFNSVGYASKRTQLILSQLINSFLVKKFHSFNTVLRFVNLFILWICTKQIYSCNCFKRSLGTKHTVIRIPKPKMINIMKINV